ncbi:MAG: hypothetical protein N2690_10945 [Rhodocyclaceae bacterium]|nr:hypothetical protein [Rhodocyclaceae bacterium]
MSAAAALIAGHLSAPCASPDALKPEHIIECVRQGALCAPSETINGLIAAGLFTEIAPELLLRCAAELGLPRAHLIKLYEAARARGSYPVPYWEHDLC